MTTQSLDQSLKQGSNPDIAKRTSVKKILFSVGMFVLGILLFLVVFQLHDKSSTFSMALMVTGSALVLVSLFRFFWKSKEVFYLPTGSPAKESSLFFNLKDLPALSKLVEERDFNFDSSVRSIGNGNVRLDILLSKDHQFVALQLFQFVPYTYSPVTSVAYFKDEDAASVCTFLSNCKD